MANFTKPIMLVLVLIDLALISKIAFSNTSLSKTVTAGERVCEAVQPNMSLADVRMATAKGGGAFTQFTPEFGVVSKSFCRCGIQLQDGKVVSTNHQVWCLN